MVLVIVMMVTYKPPEDVICPCGSNDKSGTMLWIPCKNPGCKTPWWHASCAGFQAPKQSHLKALGDWHCPFCVSEKYAPTTKATSSTQFSENLEGKLVGFFGKL